MVQPADFLAQAKKLLAAAGSDLDYRGVIDRAYYGAYHAAREFEERLPHRSELRTDRVGSHEALILRLECPHPKLEYGLLIISKDIGAQLRQLKPLRELASYELTETIRVDQAEAAIEGAKEVLTECGNGLRKLGKQK